MSSKGNRRRSYDDELAALRDKIETIPAPTRARERELSRFTSATGPNAVEIDTIKPTVVDLFCGAGGLSLGFTQAGFQISLACDLDAVACDTFRLNHPDVEHSRIITGDVREHLPLFSQIIGEGPDVLAGGPPCQGFSQVNQRSPKDDPRNALYRDFVRAAEVLQPKFIVMENVRGMTRIADAVCRDFEAVSITTSEQTLSYKASYQLFNAYDFGVAQNRERLIFIGVRTDLVDSDGVTPEVLLEHIAISCENRSRYVLTDALDYLRPLEAPHRMHVGEIDTPEWGGKVELNPYKGNESPYLRQINLERTIPYIYNHKARYCSELNHEIYSLMEQGDDGTCHSISNIFPYKHRNRIFKDKYFRLFADRPCRTITAHLRSDCHSHIHPTQARGLNPREAARAQSFPDDYLFMGPYLIPYIHIGNAVPPVMSKVIASSIMHYLDRSNQ